MTQNEQPAAPAPASPATAMPPIADAHVAYAGFWVRVGAWIIDAIALGILTTALAPLFGGGTPVVINGNQIGVNYGASGFGTLFGLVYFVGLWTWRGQTIGMMPFRLFVVGTQDGAKPDIVRAFLRYVGLVISFLVILLGVIWVAFDARKQGWHDKLANTVVIRR